MALLTEAREGRSASALRDLDFYSDAERAAWRPSVALERLAKSERFAYRGDVLVTGFAECGGEVSVATLGLDGGGAASHTAKRLVLAAGALGSARIAARSSGRAAARMPLLCNPYSYVVALLPARFGRGMPERATSLCQLAIFHDPGGSQSDVAAGMLYSYRSLLMFRLLKEMPFGFRDARLLMRYLMPGFLILGIHQPDGPSPNGWIELRADARSPSGDVLSAGYALDGAQRARAATRERAFASLLRTLGAWPVKRVHPPYGASIHYAGTLPFSDQERPLALAFDGRLHGTSNVYVADGSGFRYLPAKSPTLSFMANAYLVARALGARRAG